jgi:hypothetical protein
MGNNKNTTLVMFAALGLVMATAILVLPTVPEQQAHAQHHGPPHNTSAHTHNPNAIAKVTDFELDPPIHLGHH